MKVFKIACAGLMVSAMFVAAAEAKTVNVVSGGLSAISSSSGSGGSGGSGGTIPTTCSITSVTTSTACQIFAGNNDSVSDLNLFNGGVGAFGVNSWLLADKNDDGVLISPYDLIADTLGNLAGAWSVGSFNNYQYATLVVKGGAVAWVAYLLDLTQLSGTWSTADLINSGGNQPGLSHISLYVGGQQITPPPPPPPEVPLPAAGGLLLMALAGFGLLRGRRNAA